MAEPCWLLFIDDVLYDGGRMDSLLCLSFPYGADEWIKWRADTDGIRYDAVVARHHDFLDCGNNSSCLWRLCAGTAKRY